MGGCARIGLGHARDFVFRRTTSHAVKESASTQLNHNKYNKMAQEETNCAMQTQTVPAGLGKMLGLEEDICTRATRAATQNP
jgi:hypothetical protein